MSYLGPDVMLPLFFLIQKNFVSFFARVTEKEKEKQILYPLIHLPNDHNCQELGWSEARSPFWMSHVGTGAQTLTPLPFKAIIRELDWKQSSQDSNSCPHGMPPSRIKAYHAMPWHQPLRKHFLHKVKLHYTP